MIVPAMSRDDDPAVLAWLRQQSSKGAIVIGVRAGAKVVGAAGLLDGKRATTRWYCRKGSAGAQPDDRLCRGPALRDRISGDRQVAIAVHAGLLCWPLRSGPQQTEEHQHVARPCSDFSISLDGFGTGEGPSRDHPLATRTSGCTNGCSRPDGGGRRASSRAEPAASNVLVRRHDTGIGAEIMGAGKYEYPGWHDDYAVVAVVPILLGRGVRL